jgi:hypothetical protein
MPKPKRKKVKTAIFLRAEQIEQLRKIAAGRDVSMSQLIREGIDTVLKKYKNKQ